jgi:hypothetical protein
MRSGGAARKRVDPDGRPERLLTAAILVPAKPRSAISAAAASMILRRDSTPSFLATREHRPQPATTP